MPIPKPKWQVSIPSIYDGLQLDCRIYHPEGTAGGAAIFAHPYAGLGGSMDDSVVDIVAADLLGGGFIVGLFNFR